MKAPYELHKYASCASISIDINYEKTGVINVGSACCFWLQAAPIRPDIKPSLPRNSFNEF